MQANFTRRVGLQFFSVAIGVLMMACAAGDGAGGGGETTGVKRWEGQTVYSKVGMRVEPTKDGMGWHMYSTNHIGLQRHLPVGTKFTARGVGRGKLELVTEDNSAIKVEFVARHHKELTFDSWLDRQLSMAPVELPGEINSSERAAIQEGKYEVGMSRPALFLSIGYPPSTSSPDLNGAALKYEVKRFNSIVFTFDDQGKLRDIKN